MKFDAVGVNPAKFDASYIASEISSCRANGNYAKVLSSSQQLADSFSKTDEEGNTVKSPLATIVSVAGVVLSTFLLGKNVGKLGASLAKKLPTSVKDKAVNVAKGAVEKLNQSIGKIKNTKISENLTKVVNGAVEYVVKDPTKAAANIVGAGAVVAVAPDVINADANGDGIADIAQHNVNAYKSALQGAELLADIVSALT